MIPLLLDHLWQSTLFAAAAGVLTLAFTRNRAAIRYWLWFAASVKFLLPFSLLTALGAALSQAFAPPVPQAFFAGLWPAAEPFSGPAPLLSAPEVQGFDWPPLLFALWALGFATLVAMWFGRWLKLRAAIIGASPLPIDAPMPVKSSATSQEPGLVGIWRPVLILPQGIASHLSEPQMQTILAHEICHLRRRDNLLAAIHMGVEAIFWFHPLVWWLGARLIAERENACDEAVLASGSDPKTYAESILKVCQFYMHSPLACASGVSGADLRRRIEAIMENKITFRLNAVKKSLLATCATAAITAPLVFGLLTAPPTIAPALALTAAAPHPGTEAALRHQIESMEKGSADFGVMAPALAQTTQNRSARSQANIRKWGVLKSVTFWGNQNGADIYSVEFENQLTAWTIAPPQPDGKISVLFFDPAFKRDGNGASPGLQAAVRRELYGNSAGKPALEIMSPDLQTATRRQWPTIGADAKNLGAVQAITFQAINSRGWDVYHVTFANGTATVQAAPLTDGKLSDLIHTDIVLPHQPQHPGTEASLRRYIESLEKGQPNYDEMEPQMAAVVKQQLSFVLMLIKSWGALRSIVFKGGGTRGVDVYEVTFAHAQAQWIIAALDADGKVIRSGFRQLP